MHDEQIPGQLEPYDDLIRYIADTDAPFITSNVPELISCFGKDQKRAQSLLTVADLYLEGAHFTNSQVADSYQRIDPDAAQLLFSGTSTALLYGEGALAFFQDIVPKVNFSAEQVFGEYLELDYVLSGDCDIEVGGQSFSYNNMPRVRISSGSVGQKQVRTYTKGTPVRNVSIWLRPQFLTRFFGIDPKRVETRLHSVFEQRQGEPISFHMTNRITAVIEDVYSHPFHGSLAYHYISAKVTELLCLTVALFKEKPEMSFIEDGRMPSNKVNSIAAALEIINSNLSQALNSDDLAKQVGMSKSSLSRSFKSLYGITPNEYQTRKRMKEARRLLKEGRLSVQEVAWQVGYESQSSFGRTYKQYFHCAPSAEKLKA